MTQKVNGAAGAPEFLIARSCSGLRGEPVEGDAPLSKTRGASGCEVRVGSVKASIDVGQLVLHVADLEISPHAVILATARLDIELAQRRRHFLHDTVVAEGGVMSI